MHGHTRGRIGTLGMLVAAAAATSCGSGSDSGPTPSPLVIAKAPIKSGDAQTGAPGLPLPSLLRVIVTRDGTPEQNVAVTWSAGSGAMSPGSAQTDANGESTTIWTLGDQAGPQTGTASVSGATGSPVTFTATATITGTETIVQVLGPAGGNRFDPANITITAGTTVTWQWADGALSHNVVPDAAGIPATSGLVTDGPHTYQYTFDTPGTYHYHCASHGGINGVGMSGTVSVTAQP
jgi:plastocyanin